MARRGPALFPSVREEGDLNPWSVDEEHMRFTLWMRVVVSGGILLRMVNGGLPREATVMLEPPLVLVNVPLLNKRTRTVVGDLTCDDFLL